MPTATSGARVAAGKTRLQIAAHHMECRRKSGQQNRYDLGSEREKQNRHVHSDRYVRWERSGRDERNDDFQTEKRDGATSGQGHRRKQYTLDR